MSSYNFRSKSIKKKKGKSNENSKNTEVEESKTPAQFKTMVDQSKRYFNGSDNWKM